MTLTFWPLTLNFEIDLQIVSCWTSMPDTSVIGPLFQMLSSINKHRRLLSASERSVYDNASMFVWYLTFWCWSDISSLLNVQPLNLFCYQNVYWRPDLISYCYIRFLISLLCFCFTILLQNLIIFFLIQGLLFCKHSLKFIVFCLLILRQFYVKGKYYKMTFFNKTTEVNLISHWIAKQTARRRLCCPVEQRKN